MSNFDRGFKSWSERTATSLRSRLKLKPHDPLLAFDLAKLLDVKLLKPEEITGLDSTQLSQLVSKDGSSWSAVTLCIENKHIVIYNTSHLLQRQSTDIMHELAHVIIGHKPSRFFVSANADMDIPLRDFDKKQEEEADWLSYCLLLPRVALEHIKRTNMSDEAVLQGYKVSGTLLKMRMALTGVNLQMKRFSKYKKKPLTK